MDHIKEEFVIVDPCYLFLWPWLTSKAKYLYVCKVCPDNSQACTGGRFWVLLSAACCGNELWAGPVNAENSSLHILPRHSSLLVGENPWSAHNFQLLNWKCINTERAGLEVHSILWLIPNLAKHPFDRSSMTASNKNKCSVIYAVSFSLQGSSLVRNLKYRGYC